MSVSPQCVTSSSILVYRKECGKLWLGATKGTWLLASLKTYRHWFYCQSVVISYFPLLNNSNALWESPEEKDFNLGVYKSKQPIYCVNFIYIIYKFSKTFLIWYVADKLHPKLCSFVIHRGIPPTGVVLKFCEYWTGFSQSLSDRPLFRNAHIPKVHISESKMSQLFFLHQSLNIWNDFNYVQVLSLNARA